MNLRGRQLQYLRAGRTNNVDLRAGFPLGGETVTIVASEERERDQIVLYRVDPTTRRLLSVAARQIDVGLEVYGSCMYRSVTFSKSTAIPHKRVRRRREGPSRAPASLSPPVSPFGARGLCVPCAGGPRRRGAGSASGGA